MNLKHLTDDQLTKDLKQLVLEERNFLTKILYHLKEIEHRKLFVEFECSSLYEYACKELKYSSDQACRRIQAMRLLKKVPEVALKINSGELSLSNINQAQRFFNENKVFKRSDQIQVLKKLVNKSVREGQKEILKLSPLSPLPRETKKQVTPTYTQVSFNMSEDLEKKFEDIKTLLGPKTYNISMSQLIETVVDLASQKLQEKKFGKKRGQKWPIAMNIHRSAKDKNLNKQNTIKKKSPTMNVQGEFSKQKVEEEMFVSSGCGERDSSTYKSAGTDSSAKAYTAASSNTHSNTTVNKNSRYISEKLKHYIWYRDKAKCKKCKSKTNLHLDHIKPVSLGGTSTPQNLRLLCFHCNQRQRMTMKLKDSVQFFTLNAE